MCFGKKAKYKGYHAAIYRTSINALVIVHIRNLGRDSGASGQFLRVFGLRPSLINAVFEW